MKYFGDEYQSIVFINEEVNSAEPLSTLEE